MSEKIVSTDPSEVLVQGKTFEEWNKEGFENEQRSQRGEDHVHPVYPEDHEPTEDEQHAFINSLTIAETIQFAARQDPMLASIMGLLQSMTGDD